MNYNFFVLVEFLLIENNKVIIDFKFDMIVKEIREVKKIIKEEKFFIIKIVIKVS